MTYDLTKHVGFTGTRVGMTEQQKTSVAKILLANPYEWLHHGDCLGSDQQVHNIIMVYRPLKPGFYLKISIHPPMSNRFRAWCEGDTTHNPGDYLTRNRDIVNCTCCLIAAPAEYTEQLRSGTWATIRYARKVGKLVSIVFPNGNISYRAD